MFKQSGVTTKFLIAITLAILVIQGAQAESDFSSKPEEEFAFSMSDEDF